MAENVRLGWGVLGRSPKQALENSLDVDQMFYVLNQKADFPRKTALVLSTLSLCVC